MSTWIYKMSEEGLWTVGHYERGTGRFIGESDHRSPDSAAQRVHWLNGGCSGEPPAPEEED